MPAKTKFMKSYFRSLSAHILAVVLASSVTLPAWAGDPFRTTNPRVISPQAESAFQQMFKQGNYAEAVKQVDQALKADTVDPIVYGIKASLYYLNKSNNDDLEFMNIYAKKTRDAAQKLLSTDPLRGHIYTGVSYLLEAGYIVTKDGLVRATPRALGLVQQLLDEMKLAEEIDPTDPEFNLIKGYMDMLIAGVLPLADLETALESLRKSSPEYLKWRGIALGYRDAKKADLALDAVNKALAAAPENPELHYLKGQILWQKGGNEVSGAKQMYRLALSKAKQLPPVLAKQINSECTQLTGKSCL